MQTVKQFFGVLMLALAWWMVAPLIPAWSLMLGWGLATTVGFIAAVLIAPGLFLSPPMMVSVVIYALAAATLGGWDSPAGAIVGGLIIGASEKLALSPVPLRAT